MSSTLLEIQENVPLASLTTLKVGGSARFFARAENEEQVAEAVRFSQSRRLPLFVLGGGSNVVISDAGWNGLVLNIGIGGLDQRPNGPKIHFDIGAGLQWDEFVAESVNQDCAGIECLSGIPGSIGGTPVQNVGAYGQEVSDSIVSAVVFDLAENRVLDLSAEDCGFAYRSSIFNSSARGRYIILRVTYALQAGGKPVLRYADLQKYFAGGDGPPSLRQVREAVRAIRAAKGMLIVPGDRDSCSAGSFFKNPVVSMEAHADLLRRAAARNLEVPSYPALEQQHKIPAAWLVEHSGFSKGYVKGNVGISSKHALAIVNSGGASAKEIVALKNEIQTGVEREWGIQLEPEPVMVGF